MSNRENLRWLAFVHHVLVTTDQAAAAGPPAVELRKLAARGALSRVGFGVYRMNEAPTSTPTPYAQALAVVGPGSMLADESILALHELPVVNPRPIKVATHHRVRTKLPATIELIHGVTTGAVEVVDGLATMPLKDALQRSRSCDVRWNSHQLPTENLLLQDPSLTPRIVVAVRQLLENFSSLRQRCASTHNVPAHIRGGLRSRLPYGDTVALTDRRLAVSGMQ